MKILIYILLLLPLSIFSQNLQKIDSLKTIFKTTKNDTTKIETLKSLFKENVNYNKDSALVYQKKMLAFSEANNFDYGLYHAYFYLSFYDYLSGNLEGELYNMKSAIPYAEKMNNPRFQVDSYLRLNSVFNRKGVKDSSIYYLNKSIKIAEENDFEDQVAFCNLELGNIYLASNENDKALIAYQKSISILSSINPKHQAIAVANSNIGIIYYDIENYNKAREYYLLAEELYREINDIRGLIGIQARLGEIDIKLKNFQEARPRLQEAYNYYKESGDKFRLAETSNNLADVVAVLDGEDKALPLYLEGLELRKTINDSIGIASSSQYLGEYYLKNKEYKKSETYFLDALNLGKKLHKLNLQKNSIYSLSVVYKNINDYKNAFKYLNDFNILNDSLSKLNNIANIQELETKYQTEKKEQEIALLISQKELSEQQKTNQRYLLLSGIGISTIAGLFFFFLYRNKQKTNRKLKELDIAKSHFFTNISHEFRTPLTLIQSPIEEELEHDLTEKQRKKFTLIKRNTNRLLNLVDQLLLLSKIEAKALKLQVQETDLTEFLSAIVSSFQYNFEQKHILFNTEINTYQTGFLDLDFLEKILSNLLSNALKYTPEHGEVNFKANIEMLQLKITISNTGEGMTPEQSQQIFNKFYQVNNKQLGYGIGLTLVKELIDSHKGTIKVTSNNQETVFKISLPIDKSIYTANEISQILKPINLKSTYPSTDVNHNEDVEITTNKPILLIVEDHEDMRDFTKCLFENTFEIIEANNGKIGIEKALEFIPDIIISDVMMPETDGIELVKTLKADLKTSHIPIVLLTAKVEETDQIKGILTGADDYILKPFSPKLIQAKINTILKNAEKSKKHYSQEVHLKPVVFSVNSSEEKFFEKLQNIINEKLQNPDFNVDSFSNEIGMSRMQLHRKLKATIGISASEFLRTERLKIARNLFQSTDLTVQEVAYSTGFNDANYFSKSFKKLFNVSPTDFKSQFNT
jgi:signal transduction histidine kinase/DNA-binding response OmpR family regulator